MRKYNKKKRAEYLRDYRKKNWLRVREIEKRYRASEKGRKALREGVRRYSKTDKGKATAHRTYVKNRDKYLERAKHWRKNNYQKVLVCHEKWLKTTPAGRKYQERHTFQLPAHAPDNLIETCKLLRALKQEKMKYEHYRA